MDTDDINRMLVEIVTGKRPSRPDTVEEARMRAQLRTECDEIAAKGFAVDIPFELPEAVK